jgi:hypothetical protein
MIPPGGEVQERQRLSWPPEASSTNRTIYVKRPKPVV